MPQLPSPGNSTEPNLTSHATPLAAYSRTLSRRDALYRGVTACALASTGLSEICTATTSDDPYQPFQMGIQSYSLRGYGLDDALKHTRALGLRFWESYRGHFPVTTVPKDWKQYQETLKRAGVRMVALAWNRLPKIKTKTVAGLNSQKRWELRPFQQTLPPKASITWTGL